LESSIRIYLNKKIFLAKNPEFLKSAFTTPVVEHHKRTKNVGQASKKGAASETETIDDGDFNRSVVGG
jgi:hypothetical protein